MSKDFNEQLEEAKAAIKPEVPETPEAIEQPEVPDIEAEAIKKGWNPNYKGEDRVSAKEYIDRGSFFRKIESQNKRIDELLTVVKKLDEHNSKLADAEYQRGMRDALDRRAEAVALGDVDGFNRAEADLTEMNKRKPVPVETKSEPVPTVSPEMIEWVEENKSWFNNNTKQNARMVKEADGLFMLESQDNPDLSPKEILGLVKAQLKKLHPEVFENPNKERPAAVGKSSVTQTTKVGLAARLTKEQNEFFDSAKSAGIKMSREEYAKQLDASGDLRDE